MKKYWKSMSIAVVTIVTIGFFYIQSALAGSNYPEFVFETVSGDEEEMADIKLYGDFRKDFMMGDNFQITAEGTQYNRDLSYFDRLDKGTISPELKQLQDEFKNFMRGKHSLFQLAENEQHVAYANVNSDMEFEIEVLDKDSNETDEFSVDVPDDETYSFIHIEQVNIAGENIKVVTRNYEGLSTEIHVYDFDIGEQRMISDETVISFTSGSTEETMTTVFMPGDGSNLHSNSHAIFILEQREDVDMEGVHSNLAELKLISINLETNEQYEIELTEENQGTAHTAMLEGSLLYFTNLVEDGVEITIFDLENQELEESSSFTIERDNININTGPPLASINDGKMYLVSYADADNAQANIFVIEVPSGELLYEGQIVGVNGDAASTEYTFHLLDMGIR